MKSVVYGMLVFMRRDTHTHTYIIFAKRNIRKDNPKLSENPCIQGGEGTVGGRGGSTFLCDFDIIKYGAFAKC